MGCGLDVYKERLIRAVPEKYRDDVKEILKYAKEIREMHNGRVSWGLFAVCNYGMDGEFFIWSMERVPPEIVPPEYVIEERMFVKAVNVPRNEIALLRTWVEPTARFEIIGLLLYPATAYLLKVDIEDGCDAVFRLEDKLLEQ